MTNITSVKKLFDNGKFTNTYRITTLDDREIYVPHAEGNTDYQNILKWVAEVDENGESKGNTIEDEEAD